MATKTLAKEIHDDGASITYLDAYWFLGKNGPVTMTGIFVDINGHRVAGPTGALGPAFSGVVPVKNATVTDGVTFATIAGLTGALTATYPEVVGAVVDITGDLYVDMQNSGAAGADFKANPTKYPTLPAGFSIKLGRVNKAN